MTEGRKPEYPEKTPGDELQKMPHTTARRLKPQARLEPAQYHWWQARKADMVIVTPRVAPITDCIVVTVDLDGNDCVVADIDDSDGDFVLFLVVH